MSPSFSDLCHFVGIVIKHSRKDTSIRALFCNTVGNFYFFWKSQLMSKTMENKLYYVNFQQGFKYSTQVVGIIFRAMFIVYRAVIVKTRIVSIIRMQLEVIPKQKVDIRLVNIHCTVSKHMSNTFPRYLKFLDINFKLNYHLKT